MTANETHEYKKLALDSSNELMDHDGDRGLGRYEQAALHIREAGFGRLRMGQIAFDAGRFDRAVADWLSAAACFYLVPDLERMKESVECVRELDRGGKIPVERRDLHASLKERVKQLSTLDRKVDQFLDSSERLADSMTMKEVLNHLLPQIRELPGLPQLHAGIASAANAVGQRELAIKHLEWAEKFEPGNPEHGYERVAQLIDSGELERGVQLGQELLKVHPELDHLRTLLTQTIAFREGASKADWGEALELLRPLTEGNSADADVRLLALSQAAMLHHGIGDESGYRRLLRSFDELAETEQTPNERDYVTKLRQEFPSIFPQPCANGTVSSSTEMQFPLNEADSARLSSTLRTATLVAA